MASKYTEADELAIRESLLMNDGNVKRTARELGLPYATVHARKQLRGLVSETISDEDASLWARASRAVAQRIAEVAPQSEDLGQLAAAARAASTAHLDYRDGRKGAINVHNGDVNQTLVIEYAEDWRG